MESAETYITAFVVCRNNRIHRDGQRVFESNGTPDEFFNAAYADLGINYPKFYKMDRLCKPAYLASEYLLRGNAPTDNYKPQQTALIVSNKTSSIDTDLHFSDTINTGPSPALFVYTLPNIMLGEICIRHAIKGETACFIFDIFNPAFHVNYANYLLANGKAEAVIAGWADYYNGKWEAFFYLVEKNRKGTGLLHDDKVLNEIYCNQ